MASSLIDYLIRCIAALALLCHLATPLASPTGAASPVPTLAVEGTAAADTANYLQNNKVSGSRDNHTISAKRKILGGWSMSLTSEPLAEFDYIMYGMVTNLDNLTTGTRRYSGWSPKNNTVASRNRRIFNGKSLWVYGGSGCFPTAKPAKKAEIDRIVETTRHKKWDGVNFDDHCNMNITGVIQTMKTLKRQHKKTSFGFTAGYNYNHPNTTGGKTLNNNIKAIIQSGHCDQLIHLCYDVAMWKQADITQYVKSSLKRSISYGMPAKKIILALTTKRLTNNNLHYFLDQIIDLNLGGLFIWQYEKLTIAHLNIIKRRLKK